MLETMLETMPSAYADKKEQQGEITNHNIPDDTTSFPGMFSSVDFGKDFGKFLKESYPKSDSTPPFLSKDSSVSGFGSMFKSKDAFSKMFASAEWGMKYTKTDKKTDAPAPQKKMSAETKKNLAKVLSSQDWMPMETLGSHVDVSYSQNMFIGSDPENSVSVLPPPELPPAKTDWDNMFFSQLQLVPPPPPPPALVGEEDDVPELELKLAIPNDGTLATIAESPPSNQAAAAAPKKKRKRKPRKKVVPEVKVYVEPTEVDVLMGRGGRSNHHPGNKRYREEVNNLHTWYLGIGDKDEKTDLSQCLVDYVHSYKGRFLESDKVGWFVVPNIVARRKASQALREDNDPEKRAQKRARFLEKKAYQENKTQG